MGTKNKRSGTQFNPKGVTQGVTLVCPSTGDPVATKVDAFGNVRLLVDSQISVSIPSLQVDLDGCSPDGDSVHIVDRDSCDRMKVNSDGSIDVNTEVDASDGDNIAISAHPNPITNEDADTITTAVYEEIYSFTSTSNDTRIIVVECYVETPCTFKLFVDGVEKKRKSSDGSDLNLIFKFEEHKPLALGKVLKIEAKVERFFTSKSPYDTFVSLEGYLK